MLGTKRFGTPTVAGAFLALTACGTTQTAAFRQMSAADHDAEAKALQAGDPGAASDHIAAAGELRAKEQAACVNISDSDRNEGPLAHPDRIVRVSVIRDRLFPKGMLQPIGIAVYLRAEPGMTEQLLYRITECHLAHYAVIGRSAADQSPLAVKDTKVSISATPDGYRVAITSRDTDATNALVARGEDLGRRANTQLARE